MFLEKVIQFQIIFRFCTEKLKIKPTSKFILDQLDEMGEAIVLIGTRLMKVRLELNQLKNMKLKEKTN